MKLIKNISNSLLFKISRRAFVGFENAFISNTIHEWLLLSSFFSCLLLLIRITVTDSFAFVFLAWNLFLAFIPYWITWWITKNPSITRNKFKTCFVIVLWLLFVPNSFYIVTDLFHLTHAGAAPKWFDVLMVFSFAWNGIICGIISIRRIEVMIAAITRKSFSAVIVFILMWLCAFGVYVGRFLRFNSWDIITNPFSLGNDILNMAIHPFANFYSWGMTFCYSVFMTLLYYSIKKLGESFSIQNLNNKY